MSEAGEQLAPQGWIDKLIHFFLTNRLMAVLGLLLAIGWGLYVMPFDIDLGEAPRDPVPVDAIPDIGENQQIVFTEWPGRSPQDVEDQITYPMTVEMLGVPGVKTIRSFSMFGFSSVYVVFEDDIEFYWSRSRVLERLASAQKKLPPGVTPTLGPDATALGQVFWYTLEGEGFSLHELRSIQDWYVRYALQSAFGVSEVASVGGYVREYQVDVDPDAMRAHGVHLHDIFKAVRRSNLDVGARTIEVNRVEYVIRGVGFLKSTEDLERSVVKATDGVPVYLSNVGHVTLGPALRRGALDKEGAEAVGGVVVVRFGANPLQVIKNVKEKIDEVAPGLPKRTLADGRESQVKIVPFYDRTQLIHETLGTLEEALSLEILVTILVVLFMVIHLKASLLVSGLLPLAVLMSFVAMRYVGVDSNIMSLSGIAIAIGTVVDMGVIMSENMLRHLESRPPGKSLTATIYTAASEVGGAVVTAVSTTVVSFMPVFAMTGPEGKLFRPLAFTKTFMLVSSVLIALMLIPPMFHILMKPRLKGKYTTRQVAGILAVLQLILAAAWGFWEGQPGLVAANVVLLGLWTALGAIHFRLLEKIPAIPGRFVLAALLLVLGVGLGVGWRWWIGFLVAGYGIYRTLEPMVPAKIQARMPRAINIAAIAVMWILLSVYWMPLGIENGSIINALFVGSVVGGLLFVFWLFQRFYEPLLRYFLRRKILFSSIPVVIVLFGFTVWLGFDKTFSPVRKGLGLLGVDESTVRSTSIWVGASHAFPGMQKEFMPPLDEGSFLYMPTTMPHASIGEALDVMSKQDMAFRAIPEVDSVVGKIGRVESPLDPAPLSMVETVITYVPEYGPPDPETGERKRQWRDHIHGPDDIWQEIVKAGEIVGTTSAPKLQPISARIVMLQSGMRAPMGVKILGAKLEEIEQVALDVERFLKEVPKVKAEAVIADRVVGKPYLEIHIDREAVARYGIHIQDVQDVIQVAVGGVKITSTVEGRERYPVRVRYRRELRDSIEDLGRILVAGRGGAQIPLSQLSEIRYVRGPQMIKAEDTFLVAYVLFDKRDGFSEVETVEAAQRYLDAKLESGELVLPPGTKKPIFAGSYENQVRAERKLKILVPLALAIIFLILYLQFHRVSTTLLVFSGILMAWSGGFILLWLYSLDWFLDFAIAGVNMRDLFQVHTINLSVAVWVGFIALFGIASDDGVVIATYLDQTYAKRSPKTRKEIQEATVEAGLKRIRPCLMTIATTVIALLPVMTSQGRGADVMVPMALPTVGGMMVALLTVFVVPVGYTAIREMGLGKDGEPPLGEDSPD
jgi:Cu(I)/Ag(I) efflux system membrane protein CusA/SilA